jgi:hypothetical protein
MQPMSATDAAELIRMEYMEMPGLQLTFWQAQRLWNLSEDQCDRALRTLTASGFLVRAGDGCYRRPHAERTHTGYSHVADERTSARRSSGHHATRRSE